MYSLPSAADNEDNFSLFRNELQGVVILRCFIPEQRHRCCMRNVNPHTGRDMRNTRAGRSVNLYIVVDALRREDELEVGHCAYKLNKTVP